MKKKLIILIIIILIIMIFLVAFIELKRMKFEKISFISEDIIKEDYDIEVNLESYEKNTDKTGSNYILYFSKVDDFELYGVLSIDDISNISDDCYIALNIEDLKLAKKIQDKYGENYELVKLKFYIANEMYPTPYYRFLLKNNGEGYPYLEGKVPVNRNVDEIFEENENSAWY